MKRILLAIAARMPASWLRRVGVSQWTGPLARKLVVSGSAWLRTGDVTISHGVATGLRFNASGANPGYALGTTEPLTQDALAKLIKPGMVIYDIGANVGFFTVLMAKLTGPTGAVFAFEPMPVTADAARRNAALNQFEHVTVTAAAVGRASGTVKLAIQEESTWAKLDDGSGTSPTIDVPMVAIDALVAAGTIKPPALIKIDVEGAELEAIEGMRATLREHRPAVLCEMHGKNREYAVLMEALDYSLRALESDEPVATGRWDVHALATPRKG